jgi:hypothetical protein
MPLRPDPMPYRDDAVELQARRRAASGRELDGHVAAGVNLMAWPSRLDTTWRRRARSPVHRLGQRGSTNETSSSPLARAAGASRRSVSPMHRWSETALSARAAASIPSSRGCRHDAQQRSGRRGEHVDVLALLDVRAVSLRSSAMPSTPFMGVRSSWLISARKPGAGLGIG